MREITSQSFFVTRCVVLATGTNDCPNRLGISGENLSWVHHDLKELEKELVENKEKGINSLDILGDILKIILIQQ